MSAARLIARWTGRVVWRERRQYTAMFALILVAGAASISAALFAFHTTPPPERDHAGGQLEVTASDDPDVLIARLTASGVPFARLDRATLSVDATSQRVETRVLNAENPVASPWLSVVRGRLPTDPGEVAVTDQATLDDLTVGGELTLGRRSARVVGIVENPTDLGDEFAIVTALDQFPDAVISTSFLVDADAGVVDSIVGLGGQITTSDSGSRSSSALLMVAVTTIGMLEVALLVGLGFAVAARRRTVEFGTLAAIGATPRQLRAAGTMVGVMIGGVGAGAGAALGVAVAAGALTRLETQIGHRIDPTVPWWIVVFNVAIAVGAGAIVSRRPLKAMARQPVVDLLRAARPPVDRSWRSAVVGAAVVAAGILALGVGFSSHGLLSVALGTILTPVGFMLVAPIASVAVARLTGAGMASRLAARTIARDHRRSGTVAAAIAMVLAVPVAIGVVSASVDAGDDDRGPNLAPNSFAVWHPGASETGSRIPALLDQEALADAESRLAGSVEGLSFARVEVAVPEDAVHERWHFSELGTREAVEPLLAGRPYDGRCLNCDVYSFADDDVVSEWTVDSAWIANEQLLGAVGIDAADLADADAVVRSDGIGMLGPSGPIGDVAVADDWPHLSRVPPLLVSPDALGDGDTALPIGFLVTTEHPLASSERDVLRSVVGDGLTIEFHQPPEPSSGLRAIALLSGALLGLALVAGAIGLLNDELEPDRRLLTQMGATPRQLRQLGASLAAQLGIAGAALGLVIGCSALVPLRAIDDSTLPLAVPWAPLVTLAVGFPITAAVVGWIGSGRAIASPSASRQLGD